MPSFSYRALDGGKTVCQGEIDAKSKDEAYRKLVVQGLKPIQIGKAGEDARQPSSEVRAKAPPRLAASRLLQFTEELADLLESGLQLEQALRVIESREENSPVKPVASYLRQQIREGKSFSAALRECEGSFSELYVNMVAAGEAAGALESILRRQAQHTAVLIDLQKRVTMALIYPAIVFVTGLVLMAVFIVFLLPQLTGLLAKTGKELPFVTQVLIALSGFLTKYWWAIFSGVGAIFLSHKLWIATKSGRAIWDRLKLKIPLVGTVLRQQFFAQFLQTLATLLANGVVLMNAMVLVRNATSNTYIKGIIAEISEQVGEGVSLSRCMKKTAFFPSVLIDIVGVGEQTGKIGPALERGATRYDKEFNAQIQRLTVLIQPVIILFVAGFVGLIAYSMITGILTTVSGLRMR